MIRVPVKKQNLILKKTRKSPLKLNSRLPSLRHLTIVKLTPSIKNQRTPSFEQKPQEKNNKGNALTLLAKELAEKRSKNRSCSCPFTNDLSSIEFSRKIEILQEKIGKQQNSAKAQEKSDDQTSTIVAQSAQRQASDPQSLFIYQQTNQALKKCLAQEERIEKKSECLPTIVPPRLTPSSLLAIYRVLSETVQFEKTAFIATSDNIATEKLTQLNQDISSISSCKSEANFFILERLTEKELELARKQLQIQKIEAKLDGLKQQVAAHEQEIQQYLNFSQEAVRRQKQMRQFLTAQPSKILRSQAQGYKECEQILFDLASDLQFCNEANMLDLLSSQIEVPEASLFYAIDHFQPESEQQNEDAIEAFKDKLKSIYAKIMGKIKENVKKKCSKIQKFVQIMRKLALFTLSKREYLNEINNKIAHLSAHSASVFAQMESLYQQPNQQLVILKKIVEGLHQAYTESHIFY